MVTRRPPAALLLSNPNPNPNPTSLLLFVLPHPQQCPTQLTHSHTCSTSSTFYLSYPLYHPRLSVLLQAKYRPWDSNAESSFRRLKFNSNFQYNENNDHDDDDDDDYESGIEQSIGLFEEFLDSVWIFKVFRSYGWMLPFIILSLLLATGPKAFLMALSLPIGQSALSFAFQKLSGRKPNNPKRKNKTKKRRRGRTAYDAKLKEEQENVRTKKTNIPYQSWVDSNDVPVDKDGKETPTFGGWDELDRTKLRMEYMRSSVRNTTGPRSTSKGKLNKRERRSDTPLLLRLLIAVFPFLGSWTKML